MKGNNNNYVTRDFYDANMAEFRATVREMIAASNARVDKAVAEMKADNARVLAESQAKAAEMREQYTITQIRLDNIERSLDKFFRNAGFVLAGMTLFFTFLQIFLR